MEYRKMYRWRQGLYPAVDAQEAGERIDRLIQENGGRVTPRQVVDASRPDGEVLHPCFEWDDTKAAEKYRDVQARKVLGNIEIVSVEQVVIHQDIVVVEDSPADEVPDIKKPVRAFTNVRPEKDDGRAYMGTIEVFRDEGLKAQALMAVKTDIERYVAKYAGLEGLADILSQIAGEIREQETA
jgi:hypothetical protein